MCEEDEKKGLMSGCLASSFEVHALFRGHKACSQWKEYGVNQKCCIINFESPRAERKKNGYVNLLNKI